MKYLEELSRRNLEYDNNGSNEVTGEMKEIILNVDLPPISHSGNISASGLLTLPFYHLNHTERFICCTYTSSLLSVNIS